MLRQTVKQNEERLLVPLLVVVVVGGVEARLLEWLQNVREELSLCDEGRKKDYLHNDRGRGKFCAVPRIKGNFFCAKLHYGY